MDRVWIVDENAYEKKESLALPKTAELTFVRNVRELEDSLVKGERLLALASVKYAAQLESRFPDSLAIGLLPKELQHDRLAFALRQVLQQARVQHDLEAAENIAWRNVNTGAFEDPKVEFIGSAILDIAEARDLADLERALAAVCAEAAEVMEVKVVTYPDTASARVMGLYQLALPVYFQDELKAHIYVRFRTQPEQTKVDEISDTLLNLGDAVALAVERNSMISQAEETKAVWEASFDAVEDPVVILDEKHRVLRANRAYGQFSGIPISRVQGKALAPPRLLDVCLAGGAREPFEREGRYYQVFFDSISAQDSLGKFVLRLHDITQEKSLTEKIIAKEQVAELGILVGSVAHEINNPIGGILAIGQIMQKDIDPTSDLAREVENIVHSADRCRKIVNTMLSMVRKSDELTHEVGVYDCLVAARDLLESEGKRLQVKWRINWNESARKLHVMGNKNRLMQAFFHLLQQSLAAIAEKSKTRDYAPYVTLEAAPYFETLELLIEDNGDPLKHDYEIQNSVAFAVAKMILDEQDAEYAITRTDQKNQQKILFKTLPATV